MKVIAIVAAAALLGGSAMAADLFPDGPAFDGPVFNESSAPDVVGTFSFWLGASFIDSEDNDFENDTVFNFGGDVSVVRNMDNGFGLQIEAQGRGGYDYDPGDDPNLAYGAVAVHGYSQGDSYSFGAYGSLYGGQSVDIETANLYAGGALEAAAFLGNSTAFGQIGGGALINDGTGADSHYFGRAGWRFFANDYTKVEIDGLIGGFTGTGGSEQDGWYANWGVELERKFMGTPFAAFIAYRGYYTEEDDGSPDNRLYENVIKLGGTLRFGGDPRSVDHYMPFDAADHSQLMFVDDL